MTCALISGGGIAGLTLGILLKEAGFEPLIVEREPALRAEGYMMDFFGSGWDVAERMGLVDELRAIHYPIDALEFVDDQGKPFVSVPIDIVRRALGGKYVYLRRSDLEGILYERAQADGVVVRFGSSIAALNQDGDKVDVTFDDGADAPFDLVFGADGVHSKVRTLEFGDEQQFDRFLGAYVAAFHLKHHSFDLDRALKLHE
ncbi:MAG: FAD-dependent monooxygenase, partial [Methyloceanibacter sp.]